MRSGSRFTLAVLIPAAVTVVESAGGEELFTIPIAPFAHAALAQDPADQTLGVIPVKDNATTEVVFFKPIPNSYEAEYDVAGVGLRARPSGRVPSHHQPPRARRVHVPSDAAPGAATNS